MTRLNVVALAGIAGLIAACTQPEMDDIRPEPMFDKFGDGECVEGYVYIPGTVPEEAVCIPEDDCEPITLADGSVIWDCPPPPTDRNPGRNDDGRGSGASTSPTGGP